MHHLTVFGIFILINVYVVTNSVDANVHTIYSFGTLTSERRENIRRKREAENVLNDTIVSIVDAEGETVIEDAICVKPIVPGSNVTVTITNCTFLHFLGSGNLTFSINGTELGVLRTAELTANESTTDAPYFDYSGPIGDAISLPEGNYDLTIQVQTDYWGIDIIEIMVNATGQDTTVELLCGGSFSIHVNKK